MSGIEQNVGAIPAHPRQVYYDPESGIELQPGIWREAVEHPGEGVLLFRGIAYALGLSLAGLLLIVMLLVALP